MINFKEITKALVFVKTSAFLIWVSSIMVTP